MVGCICVVHLESGEVIVGVLELRGIYEPCYGFHLTGSHGDRAVQWHEVTSLLRVGSNVHRPPAGGVEVLVVDEAQQRSLA